MADVKYIITADAKGAVTEIKKVEGAIDGMKTQATQSKSPVSGMWKQVAAGIGVAGLAAGATRALKSAIRGMADFMGDSITKAGEQEKALKALETVLISTGGAAGLTKDEIVEMASSLQSVTTFGDEAILSGQNLLLTFTNIGKEVFPQATETMLDMSVALGQDMKASAVQLGKALQDPILGVTALRRVGVNFNQAQVDMIKKMVESGNVMGAQKFILQELQTEFGGAARAAGETFPGKLERLDNAFGDLKEQIGEVVTKNKDLNEVLEQLIRIVENLVKSGGIPRYVKLLGEIAKAIPFLADFKMNLDLIDAELMVSAAKVEYAEKQYENFSWALEEVDKWLLKSGIDLEYIIPFYERTSEEVGKTEEKHKTLIPKLKETNTELVNLASALASGKITLTEYASGLKQLEDGTYYLNQKLKEFDLAEMEAEIESYFTVLESEGSAIGSVFDSIGIHIFDTQGNLIDFVETSKPKVQELDQVWQNFARNAAATARTFFLDLADETSTFGEVWANFTQNLKQTFLNIVADMITEWVENFIKKMISSSADAGADIAKNIGSAIGGADSDSIAGGFSKVSGAVGGLASGLTAISSVVSAIANVASLFKKQGLDTTSKWHLEHIWINTKETRDYLFIEQWKMLAFAQDQRQDMNTSLWNANEKLGGIRNVLKDIKANIGKMVSSLVSIPSGQGGLDFISGSRGGLVQYHPYEKVKIQPLSQQLSAANVNVSMGALPVYISLDGRQVAMAVAKYTPELTKLGYMKIHKNSFIED